VLFAASGARAAAPKQTPKEAKVGVYIWWRFGNGSVARNR
jgi:hypothetical protein